MIGHPWIAKTAEFESKHPRNDDGEFAPKGGGSDAGKMNRDAAWRHIHNFKSPGWSKPDMGNVGGSTDPYVKLMHTKKGGSKPVVFAAVKLTKTKDGSSYDGRAALYIYGQNVNPDRISNPKDRKDTFDSPTEAMRHAELILAHDITQGHFQEVSADNPLHATIEQRKGEHLEKVEAEKKFGRKLCDRCGGGGTIAKFRHVEGGVCFKCEGAGYLASTKKGIAITKPYRHPWLTKSARFDESKHPRDGGKFSSTQGARGQSKPSGQKPDMRHNPDLDAFWNDETPKQTAKPQGGDPRKNTALDEFMNTPSWREPSHEHRATEAAQKIGQQFAFGKPHKVSAFIGALRQQPPEILHAICQKAGVVKTDTPKQVVQKFYAAFGGKVKISFPKQPPPLPSKRRGPPPLPNRRKYCHPWLTKAEV